MKHKELDLFECRQRMIIRASDGKFLATNVPAGGDHLEKEEFRHQVQALVGRREAGQLRLHPERETVALVAPDAVAAALAGCLADLRVIVCEPAEEPAEAEGLVVQWCSTPEERTRLDHLALRGEATVLRCYREGQIIFADPLMSGPGDLTGSQVQRRRLAASPAAIELGHWWTKPRAADCTLEGIPQAAVQLLGARLRSIIASWQHASGQAAGLHRTLWRLDARTLCNTEHSILPFDEAAQRGRRP